MKKLTIILTVLMFSSSSCDILEITPSDRISEGSVWSDESTVKLYVTSCYHAVEHGFYRGLWGGGISGETYYIDNQNYVLEGSLTADNITNVDPNDAYLKLGTPQGLNYWNVAYSYIRTINVFFDKIEEAPVDDNFKNQMKGEMSFLRAFVYSNLIKRYGGVPIIDYTFDLNDDYYSNISRDSYDDCVDFVCSDLNNAIESLPDRQTADDLGRASADAARALKSRVLLYAASPLNNPKNDLNKWKEASDAATVLLNSYSLYDSYQNLFLPNYISDNNEIIFARYFTQSNCHYMHYWCGRNGDYGGGTINAPTQNMVNAYGMTNGELPYLENGEVNPASGYDPQNPYINRDPRFYASILYDGSVWKNRETEAYSGGADSPEGSVQNWNASKTSYYLKKFVQEELTPAGDAALSDVNSTSPYIFFRYAEILLNYAEAEFEQGNEGVAKEYLNKIRSRIGVEMPDVTATGDELRKKIQQERRIELAFEGHRFFDVRRWKIAMNTENEDILRMEILKNADGSKTYTIKTLLARNFYEKNYLVPIPISEINKSSGALEQNTGY